MSDLVQEAAMQLREALINQSPSLELQRAAANELARLDAQAKMLTQGHYRMSTQLGKITALVSAAMERDNEMRDKERCPDGDDYETLYCVVSAVHLILRGG